MSNRSRIRSASKSSQKRQPLNRDDEGQGSNEEPLLTAKVASPIKPGRLLTKYGADSHALPHQGPAHNRRNAKILGPPQRRDDTESGARRKRDRIVDAEGCHERRQSRMARNMLLQPTLTPRKSHRLRPILRGHGNRTPGLHRASRGRKLLALSRRPEHGERQSSQRRSRERDEVRSSPNFLALTLSTILAELKLETLSYANVLVY